MKMIFAHDHFFYYGADGVYSPGKLPYAAFQRYLDHFSEVTVLSRYKLVDEISPNWVRSDGNGLNFIKLKNYSSLKNLLLPDSQQKMLENIVSSADAIIVRLPSEIGLKIAAIATKFNKPYIAEVVACPWDAMIGYGSKKSLLYAPILKWRMQKAVREAWGALYVTDHFLQERYPNFHHTASASNVELETSDESIIERRKTRILESKRITKLGLIGSLDSPHKGYDTAYRALSKLLNSGQTVELHIVGGGDKYRNLALIKQLGLEKNVFFHGVKKSGSEIYDFIDDIDIYIQPSSQEGLPRAVIEAMSRACPVVLSSAGGMPELVDKTLLHKPNDYDLMAEIIGRINADKNVLIKLATENFYKAGKFDREKLYKIRYEFLNGYKTIIAKQENTSN